MPSSNRTVRRRVLTGASLLAATLLLTGLVATPAAAESTREMQWYLDAMKAREMWEVSKGEGVTVAVLDSGTDASIPELRGQVLDGKDITRDPISAHTDKTGHGTSMSALIAGTGADGGIQGLAPGAKILPVRNLDIAWGDDTLGSIAEGIKYALKHDAKVINISQGKLYPDEIPESLQQAIDAAYDQGALIFASAGNEGNKRNHRDYPAGLPGVVAVGATDEEGKVTKFSSYGPHLALAAPGSEMAVRCDKNEGTCKGEGGTSAAAALASASAALIWSKHPDWTANQVLRVMIETAGLAAEGKEPSKYLGHGIIRPRSVLIDGEGDPGDPDKSPLFSKYYAKQDASKSPSSEPGSERNDSTSHGAQASDSGQEQAATETESAQSGNSNVPLIAGGAVAAALVLGIGAMILIRRRKTQSIN